MDDLFLHALQDIYHAGKKIVKALPTMIEKAGAVPLRDGFESHLEKTTVMSSDWNRSSPGSARH